MDETLADALRRINELEDRVSALEPAPEPEPVKFRAYSRRAAQQRLAAQQRDRQ